MRKILCIVVLLCVFMTTGCSNQTESKDNIELFVGGQMAVSDKGVYLFENSNDGNPVLYFYDKESEKLVPLCQNVNCEHRDMNCYAYQLGTIDNKHLYKVFSIVYYAERLYMAYICLTGSEAVLIKSIASDGSDLKTEYESSEIGLINGFCIFKNKLFISRCYFAEDDAGNLVGSSTVNTVCSYDLEAKEEKIIANENKQKDIMAYPIGAKDNNLYYFEFDFSNGANKGNIKEYNIETETHKTMKEYNDSVSMMYDDSIYYIENDSIIKENIITNKKESILENVHENINISVFQYGYLTYWYQNENKNFYTQAVDLNSEKRVFKSDLESVSIIGKYGDDYFMYNNQKGILKYNVKSQKEIVLYK